MGKKKSEDIVVSFADSKSVEQVTGSRIHLKYKDTELLMDFGISQGGNLKDNYTKNNQNFKFKVKKIDYVLVTHAHADHCGLLPLLFKRGGNPKVYVPTGNKPIMYEMLKSSCFILGNEAKMLTNSSKNSKSYSPVYGIEDVDALFENMVEVDFYENVDLDENIKMKFISSQHVAHSAQIILEINKGNVTKKVLYTGDLGNTVNKNYFTNNLDVVKNADLVITEATYNNPRRSNSRKDQRDKDKQRLADVIEHCQKVVIPVFSFHRGAMMASVLYEMNQEKEIKQNIYMDSLLLNKMNEIFRKQFPEFGKVLAWNKIIPIDKNKRLALQQSPEKMIVLTSSGMISGGASVSWASKTVGSKRNAIVFCGFQAVGSLGRKIYDGVQKTVTISGTIRKLACTTVKLNSFSSHMQYNELIDYLVSINCEKVAIHHSNKDGKLEFKKVLEKEYEKKCQSTKVICPDSGTKIRL